MKIVAKKISASERKRRYSGEKLKSAESQKAKY